MMVSALVMIIENASSRVWRDGSAPLEDLSLVARNSFELLTTPVTPAQKGSNTPF